MGNIYKTRLLILARYLDIMPQKDLSASTLAMGYKSPDGTCHETFYPEYASAIPMNEIFPKEWARNKDQMIVLKNKPHSPSFASFTYFFNIDIWEFMHCFVAYFQDIGKYGGSVISHEHVKPTMIANNVLGLVDRIF